VRLAGNAAQFEHTITSFAMLWYDYADCMATNGPCLSGTRWRPCRCRSSRSCHAVMRLIGVDGSVRSPMASGEQYLGARSTWGFAVLGESWRGRIALSYKGAKITTPTSGSGRPRAECWRRPHPPKQEKSGLSEHGIQQAGVERAITQIKQRHVASFAGRLIL
jgi:hypothetical protein